MEHADAGASRPASSWRRGGQANLLLALVVGVMVLWPYSVSVGAAGATFTLINRTPYFLHAVINNKGTAYVAPGAVVDYDANGYANVVVTVRYSPGQEVKGSTNRQFEIVYHTTGSSSTNGSADCSRQGNTCDSSVESSTTVTPEPVTWSVTEADFRN